MIIAPLLLGAAHEIFAFLLLGSDQITLTTGADMMSGAAAAMTVAVDETCPKPSMFFALTQKVYELP